MGSGIEIYRKKRKHWLLSAAFAILFLACFFQETDAYARQREQHTSVTVELRDADTGEIFDTYVHPWQRVGKKYTYYMEDVIYKEDKGCYMYDEDHAGTASEIASLSQEAKNNRIILYYKLYGIKENEYAVNITYKDASNDEVIGTEVRVVGNTLWDFYAVDMDYSITGNNGKTYLYDVENSKNIPTIKIGKNALKNQAVLYYREGKVKEGEAVAEVYYKEDDYLWEKSYIPGLAVGEWYKCEDKEVLNRLLSRNYGDYHCGPVNEEECLLEIEALSENMEENRIEIQVWVRPYPADLPPQYTASFQIRHIDEDTGNTLMESGGGISVSKIFYYRPTQIFYSEKGDVFYFDNTKPENILQADGKDSYQIQEDGKGLVSKCRGEVIAYYRPVKKTGEAANVCVNYLDAATGKLLKTETLPNATVGSAYNYTPKKTFAANGKLYTFDRKNAGNNLTLKTVSGHPDIDWVDAYYTGKSLKKILKVPEIKKLSRIGERSAKLTAGKVKGASGYQVLYAYNKKFKGAKKVSSAKPKITLKKLKTGKKCYVKVRAYIKTDEGKVYGDFSKRKVLK